MADHSPPAKDAPPPPPPTRWSRWRAALGSLPFSEPTALLVYAALVGLAAGLATVGFIALLRLASWLFLVELKGWLGITGGLSLLLLPLVVALGGLLIGPLVLFFPAEARGLGVPEVMESAVLRGGRIRPRTILLRALASAISIGSGGSAGREGPIVQIGAAIGSTAGRLVKMSHRGVRLLVGCGTAAGIAATFNAPLAGTLFSLEVVLGEMSLASLSPVLVAAVVATVISRALLGPDPAFHIPAYRLVSPWEIIFYLALGLLGGLVASGFVRLLYAAKDWFEDSMPRVPPVLKPALGGLAVGGAAILLPQVLGNGYPALGAALRGELPFYLLALLVLFKLGATATTLGSGGSGGIIAPSLFIGAMLGGAMGSILHGLLPSLTAAKGAYAVAGMGAVLAAATHAPLTVILLIFELTDGVSLMLPASAACLVAVAVARRLDADSVYTWKLTRRGVNLSRGREASVLGSLFVREAMEGGVELVPQEMSYREIRRLMDQSAALDFPVVDGEGRMIGLISLEDFASLTFEPELHDTVIAMDIATPPGATLRPSDTLQAALEAFGAANRDLLTVVSDEDPMQVVGMLTRQGLLAAYDRAVIARGAFK